ncbi:MBL fold metallo-hydrolase [Halorubrum ezzemoulense]|uniref:MBL fold metallo-hydrolase n=1 Tax=Halorubrum ezzemoulense TaxID=337243 RepID=UPI00232C57B5|nr:MBL fold metallo-hydrolase [Halorubrum ezzemoulense]MDB2238201.1 MBL fold metallo-hydrolase [Halorubrum ezzemoulense]MDB2247670.1 MBL fold metallo-hydrolase [Halorubrum ezzemoulense]MDB2263888.1 MBL fold metallo-hydrolase [Halorubrum ezzemoulense]MDB2269649.1 MBL fold metallo-hydrolase [Halorubrum ezzemoulense]MDB9248699.1 MBL fold metallo-hydrolase [Halorubrum ezzemoulense]
MEIEFLGGAREVGRSALLVDDALLVDYGLMTAEPPQYPVRDPEPDAVVVSHGHLDHVGAVPALLKGDRRPPIHWTPPTGELARTLAEDTLKLHGNSPLCPFGAEHVARLGEVEVRHGYGDPFPVAGGIDGGGYEVTLFSAGHIPGSAHVLVDDGDTRLLYTGDFHTDDQRLVAGTTARPDADAVICESTYADVTHEDRAAVESAWAERVERTLWEGGTVVAPAFAIGRTQEMLLVAAANDLTPYVDGMGVGVTETLRRYPSFLRDADAFGEAVGQARVVTGRDGQRKRVTAESALIVTTSGMLAGGPVQTYLPEIRTSPTNLVTLTGYQVEGTPGRELQERGQLELNGQVRPVSARVASYDFSAHADREGLESFLDAYRDARVLVNHGDRCEAFAADLRADGVDASAPEVGERIEL